MYLNRKSIAAVFMLVVLLAGCKSAPVVTNLDEIEVMAEKYRNNVVQITVECPSKSETKDGNGFGFVVGEKNSSLYIVTAKHVVCNNTPNQEPKIHVRFYKHGDEPIVAKLIEETETTYDLSILKVEKPSNYIWEKECYDINTQKGDYVWFIGIEKKWNTPPKTGIIFKKSSITNSHKYEIHDMPSVRCGTSGAPLFKNQAIIGMIINDGEKVIALDIEVIKKYAESSDSSVWQIKDCQGKGTLDRIKEAMTVEQGISEKDKIKQLKQLLEKAASYLRDSKYLEPKGENAFDIYKEILKIDYRNPEALNGIFDLLNIHKDIFKQEISTYGRLIRDDQFEKNVKEDIIKTLHKIINVLEDSKTICTFYIEHQKDQDDETNWLCKEIEKHKDEYQKKLDARLK